MIILGLPFIAAALLWNKLPARMPIHWGLTNRPDGFASKPLATLLLPCINLALAALMLMSTRLDPRFSTYDDDTQASLRRTFAAMRLAITLFFSAVALVMIASPFYPAIRVPALIIPATGLLLMILGNLMTKLRPNWFCGIRTPWTLQSKEIWTKTHRVGGRLMMAGGACIFLFGILLPVVWLVFCVVLPAIAIMSIVPMVYSYLLFARSRPAKRRA